MDRMRAERAWAMRLRLTALVAVASVAVPAVAVRAAEPLVLRGHTAGVFMAGFTPDGRRVVTASADETARLWYAAAGAEIRRFTGHTGPV
jgi:WD40 repeat protein